MGNLKFDQIRNRILQEWQKHEDQILDAERTIADFSANAPRCKCGEKMKLRLNRQNGDVFWGCPQYDDGQTEHSTRPYSGNKSSVKDLLEDIQKLKSKPVSTTLTKEERKILRSALIEFDEYPRDSKSIHILEKRYQNYLFQSLALPNEFPMKDFQTELLRYSRFRVFTQLPAIHSVDDKTRTVYSLALRLLNRGLVLGSTTTTEKKLKHSFADSNSKSSLLSLNEYITYKNPYNTYDSNLEKEFADYYFPKLFGNSWATYVYPQMPLTSLVSESDENCFKDQRVDFFVCFGGKKAVIELDGDEHKEHRAFDAQRDAALERNGYRVFRFSNEIVRAKGDDIISSLSNFLVARKGGGTAEFGQKYLVAGKIVHQVAIAIVKMLEEGHISPRCYLSLNISTELFSPAEQEQLLQFAIEEIRELIENFALLYGVKTDLDFFDKNAEKYWIHLGDGDGNRNSIVIRDIVLPINYLCSIHPFKLLMPQKEAVTEELLSYFLQYVYGFPQFKSGQFSAIQRALCQEDSIVLLPTGSGKSVIYQLSSMLLPGITVVISPLRALIEDQVSNLADRGIHNVVAIYSGDKKSKKERQEKEKAILRNHSATMLYVAPERLQIPSFRKDVFELLETNNFCLIAIDEAHCVSEWGHDFRAAYLQIGRSCRRIFKKEDFVPSIIALTGTASDNVLKDIKRDLEILDEKAIIKPITFDRPELHYSIISCKKAQKIERIKELLSEGNGGMCIRLGINYSTFSKLVGKDTYAGIIFTPLAKRRESPYSAWHIFNRLKQDKLELEIGAFFSKCPYEPCKGSSEAAQETWECIIRSYAEEFKENKKQLLVATKAFGMGIDKPNIRYIIHCGLSTSIEQYYQEVGRAGRNGSHAECVLIFSDIEDRELEAIIDPNLSWDDFSSKYKDRDEGLWGDLSPLLFFHSTNFTGHQSEESLLHNVFNYLRNHTSKSEDSLCDFVEGGEVKMRLNEICPTSIIFSRRTTTPTRKQLEEDENVSLNEVAKAVIRLATLGIIKDYEYDYNSKTFTIFLGSYARENVTEKYLAFVENCSRGMSSVEEKGLMAFQGDGYSFVQEVFRRYVRLIYETIEKGRRRALHSMFTLAREASKKRTQQEQDAYIRNAIQNYLVQDDTVELIKSNDPRFAIKTILSTYPLHPDKVVRDGDERENAKKTSSYAARMLESVPDHPGLLYLHAIALIKSENYHSQEVANDIIAAYRNSTKYSNFYNEITAVDFLAQVLNLTFNSSSELFELLWGKIFAIDRNLCARLEAVISRMKNDKISQQFKDYLQLHLTSQALQKMIGDNNI